MRTKGFVEQNNYIERFYQRSALHGAIILFISFIIISLWNNPITPDFEVGSQADFDAFIDSRSKYAQLSYCDYLNTGYTFASTETQNFGIYGNGTYIEIPTGHSKTTVYFVYLVGYDDKAAIYLRKDVERAPYPPFNGELIMKSYGHFQNSYNDFMSNLSQDMDISLDILQQSIYPTILMTGHSAVLERQITAMVLLSLICITFLVLLIVQKSAFFKKRSKLGRYISAYGDFKTLEKEIDRQAKEPLSKASDFMVTEDYVFLFKNGCVSHLLRISDIVKVNITDDQVFSDGDVLYLLLLTTKESACSVTTFEFETAQRAAELIRHKCSGRG
ncbi:hypothetical protein U6B65_01380 [Oscillospiraceae bacterium MB08-C2-2]|nr:hypothetical protein U6B65_01380 [Oscillospiraceae bacterium MB08-C2-2]